MIIYKIWCVWDMGFEDAYTTKEKAQKAIDDMNWVTMTDHTLKEVQEDGMVSIEEVEVF